MLLEVGLVDHLVLIGRWLPQLLRLQYILGKLVHVKEIDVGSPVSLIGARDLLPILDVLDQSLSVDILKDLLGVKVCLSPQLLVLNVYYVLSRRYTWLLQWRQVIGSIRLSRHAFTSGVEMRFLDWSVLGH